MAKVLEMPKLSPTMEEGQIAVWHKKEGDPVAVDDLLAEVETDKATMEFRSFDKGTLLKIMAQAGSVVKLGQPVAIIGQPGEDVSALSGEASAVEITKPAVQATPRDPDKPPPAAPKTVADAAPPTSPAASPAPPAAPAAAPAMEAPPGEASPPQATTGPTGRVKASPYVRKLARDRDLDLTHTAGSGPGGRIVARDLERVAMAGEPSAAPAAARTPGPSAPISLGAALEAPVEMGAPLGKPSSAPKPPVEMGAPLGKPSSAPKPPEVRPLTMMRKAIARRLTASKQTVPHFYLSIDVDADPLARLREQINADLAAAAGDKPPAGAPEAGRPAAKLSLNDLLIKACAIALVRVPECNAEFTPDAILIHRRVDISVAVSVPDGLMTPVIRDADQKSVLAIAAEVRELAARAKAKKLRPEEMQNGTFSISNLGMFGIDDFVAVINPPEGAILAVGQVRREPVVVGDAVVPGRRMGMTLSCDHRVVDGAVGATFLKALRELLEHPTQILLR